MSTSDINYFKNLTSVFEYYFNIISTSIGIPTNLIAIIIFARLMRNKTNMGYLYIWQCTVDILVLLLILFVARGTTTFGLNVYNQNDFTCKCFNFLRRFILHASSWIAVLITFDRFTFVLYGHSNRFRFLKSKRNLTGIILTMLTIITVADIPNLYFSINKSGSCKADFAAKFSADIISIFMRTYIPFGFMLIFNILMIRKIFKSKKLVVATQNSEFSRKETHFTLAVIACDVYFLLINFPLSIFYIFYDIYYYSGTFDVDPLLFNKYLFANAVFSDFSFLVQTLPFFMYLTFNKLFRNEFLYVLSRVTFVQSLSRFHFASSQTHPFSNTPNR